MLKRSRTAWTLDVDGYIVKVFLPKKATRGLRDLVMGNRAERALLAAEALHHRNLATPGIVATLRARNGTRSVLVMEKIADAYPLEDVLKGLPPKPRPRPSAVRVGKTLRRMHDWGLRHRDLKQQNLLLDPGRRTQVCFLDVDGVRQTERASTGSAAAKDLANLDGSLLDFTAVPTGLRLRALDAYLGGRPPEGFVMKLIETARRQRERRANR